MCSELCVCVCVYVCMHMLRKLLFACKMNAVQKMCGYCESGLRLCVCVGGGTCVVVCVCVKYVCMCVVCMFVWLHYKGCSCDKSVALLKTQIE